MKYTVCILTNKYEPLTFLECTNLKKARGLAKYLSKKENILNCWIQGVEEIKMTSKIIALDPTDKNQKN